MKHIVRYINSWLKFIVLQVQEFARFLIRVVSSLHKKPRYWKDLFDYMDIMGVGSIPIVLVAGGCAGAILATETMFQLRAYGAQVLLGRVTGVSVVRGAGPVLTAMIVASRICSAAAAELGAMQVSQQIDALVTMGIDPYRKLITPRIIAGLLMFPSLAIVNGVAAIFAGGLVAQFSNEMSLPFFLRQSLEGITPGDVFWGLTKATVFGFISVSTACYYGIRVSGGTAGVRRGATQAAVVSILMVLISDFLMTNFVRSI